MSDPRALSDELLAQAGWLRALARGLVRDADAAEDLVQESLVRALERPPGPGALRPWLARVAHNLLREERRKSARRLARESAAARPEAQPGTDEVAALLERERALLELLVALDEPYRSALYLRYRDGLAPEEIARRRGTNPATVRSHVHRGLERLRAELGRRFPGGRSAWCAWLAPILERAPMATVPLSLLPSGVLAVSTTIKLVGVAAVLAAVAFLFVHESASERSAAPHAGEARTASVPADAHEERDSATNAPRALGGLAERETLVGAGDASASSTVVPDSAPAFALRARVTDDVQRPLAGALVRAAEHASAPSGPDGEIELAFPAEHERMGIVLHVECPDRATRFVAAELVRGELEDLGTIVLVREASVSGRVLLPDGSPASDAVIHALAPDAAADGWIKRVEGPQSGGGIGPTARPDDDGTFRLGAITPGYVRVWAAREGLLATSTEPLELSAGEHREGVVLRLEEIPDRARIAGVVLAPDGSPIAHARLDLAWVVGPGTKCSSRRVCDAAGHFEVLVADAAVRSVRASDPEGRWAPLATELAPGDVAAELRLAETRWIELAVVDPRGEPIAGAQCAARLEEGVHAESVAQELAPGRVRLREPESAFVLDVRAEAREARVLGPYPPGALREPLRVELAPVALARGRVLGSSGPLAGVRVEALAILPRDRLYLLNDVPSRVDPWPAETATTDGEGVFALTLRKSGDWRLRAAVEGRAPGESDLAGYDVRLGREGIEIVVSDGGAIEGRVRGDGDRSGLVVMATRYDGRWSSARTARDGTYQIERLVPGDYQVRLAREEELGISRLAILDERSGPLPELATSCTVLEGEVTVHDLWIDADCGPRIAGALVVDGAPAAAWTAWLRPHAGASGRELVTVLDADGRFELDVDAAGVHALTIVAPPELAPRLELRALVPVDAAGTSWSEAVELASLEIDGEPAGPDERWVYAWEREGLAATVALEPGATPRHVRVPAGRGEIRRVPLGGAVEEGALVRALDVAPGASERVVLLR